MIVFGWGKDAKKIAYLGIVKCSRCRNYSHHFIYEVAKKINVYFIPVAKYDKKYFVACNVCNGGLEIEEAQKQEFLQKSLKIPEPNKVNAIWTACINTMNRYISTPDTASLPGDELFKNIMNELKQTYQESEAWYVLSIFLEYLRDPERPT